MSAIADRAWQHLAHLQADPESDRLLEGLVRGLLEPADRLSLVAHGDATRAPGEVLTNPAKAELWSLPVAAMFTGGTIPGRRVGETDDAYLARARIAVARPLGMRRGFEQSVIDLARPFVSGPIRILTSVDGDVWRAAVVVNAGSISSTDVTVGELEGDYATVADVESAFATVGATEGHDAETQLLTAVNDPAAVVAGMRIELIQDADGALVGDAEHEFRTVGDVEHAFATVGDYEEMETS